MVFALIFIGSLALNIILVMRLRLAKDKIRRLEDVLPPWIFAVRTEDLRDIFRDDTEDGD